MINLGLINLKRNETVSERFGSHVYLYTQFINKLLKLKF